MLKSIFAAIVTIIIGVFVERIGISSNVNIGSIFAIAIMGAFIMYSIENKKDK